MSTMNKIIFTVIIAILSIQLSMCYTNEKFYDNKNSYDFQEPAVSVDYSTSDYGIDTRQQPPEPQSPGLQSPGPPSPPPPPSQAGFKVVGRKLKLNYWVIKGNYKMATGDQFGRKLIERLGAINRWKRSPGNRNSGQDNSMLGMASKTFDQVKNGIRTASNMATNSIKTMADRVRNTVTG